MTTPGCDLCQFWKPHGTPADAVDGECRRYAPHPSNGGEHMEHANWTLTTSDDWCGDFVLRPGADIAMIRGG